MEDLWLDYKDPEYRKMNRKEKSLYDEGFKELAKHYYQKRINKKIQQKVSKKPKTYSYRKSISYSPGRRHPGVRRYIRLGFFLLFVYTPLETLGLSDLLSSLHINTPLNSFIVALVYFAGMYGISRLFGLSRRGAIAVVLIFFFLTILLALLILPFLLITKIL
ncbi:hypothetical protein [Acidianus sp. HS-5]|uniref:hypothetical protein n=1 Tax=Acidianus sp. HS-5 TaxID=2886040 RepID=UPI001F2746AC|nr:hypothetical protein [Acidianus sp. HS-5]